MALQARFSVGQIVHHLKFDYRGVIIDVDGADQLTYVAERHLESDKSSQPIMHPELDGFDYAQCRYAWKL